MGCLLDETMSGESIALKTHKKIKNWIFYIEESVFNSRAMMIILHCHKPHFDYACFTWYSNLTQNLKKKLHNMQNKGICFCLQLDKMCTISHKELKNLNWLPVISRLYQCVISIVFKFMDGNCPCYLSEFFDFVPKCSISLMNNLFKLKQPFWNINTNQKALCFYWSFILESNPRDIEAKQ